MVAGQTEHANLHANLRCNFNCSLHVLARADHPKHGDHLMTRVPNAMNSEVCSEVTGTISVQTKPLKEGNDMVVTGHKAQCTHCSDPTNRVRGRGLRLANTHVPLAPRECSKVTGTISVQTKPLKEGNDMSVMERNAQCTHCSDPTNRVRGRGPRLANTHASLALATLSSQSQNMLSQT